MTREEALEKDRARMNRLRAYRREHHLCRLCGAQLAEDYTLRTCRKCRIVENSRSNRPGRWILHDVVCEEQYECSECLARFVYEDHKTFDEWKYCPKCGRRVKRMWEKE